MENVYIRKEMDIMKRVGFFKELTHGDKNATSIKEIIGQNTLDKESKIINYLNRRRDFIPPPISNLYFLIRNFFICINHITIQNRHLNNFVH